MDIRTQTHLHALRELLTYRQHELQAALHAAELACAAGVAPAPGAERDRDEMTRVEAALRRLDGAAYGDCLACGAPIPLQRLLVQPAVERCAACQAARERGVGFSFSAPAHEE